MIVLRCSILAAIIFIPLTSIQHFITPVDECLLADLCNHTWFPACAEDNELHHRRVFIDKCDIHEYNCDYDVKYLPVNYSDCFGPVCHTEAPILKHVRQGKCIYNKDPRRHDCSLTVKSSTPKKPGKRRYTPKRGRMRNKKSKEDQNPKNKPQLRANPKPLRKTKPETQTTRTIVTTRMTTQQIIQTATFRTPVVRRLSYYKKGKMYFKLVKGFDTGTTTMKDNYDFLE